MASVIVDDGLTLTITMKRRLSGTGRLIYTLLRENKGGLALCEITESLADQVDSDASVSSSLSKLMSRGLIRRTRGEQIKTKGRANVLRYHAI